MSTRRQPAPLYAHNPPCANSFQSVFARMRRIMMKRKYNRLWRANFFLWKGRLYRMLVLFDGILISGVERWKGLGKRVFRSTKTRKKNLTQTFRSFGTTKLEKHSGCDARDVRQAGYFFSSDSRGEARISISETPGRLGTRRYNKPAHTPD